MQFDSLCLEINYDCTLDCFYCFRTVSDRAIDAKFIRQNHSWLELLRIKRVVISGGEPLLHPELFDIIKALKEFDGKRHVSVTTGLFVNSNKIAQLLQHDSYIDEYLLNFETADDTLLNSIKRRNCSLQLKTNLQHIVNAQPNKTRVNIVLSSHEIFRTLPATLFYLQTIGVRRVKFFRDIRVDAASYRVSESDFQILVEATREFRANIDFTGNEWEYLGGISKIPDGSSSQAICITNKGEILEREERDLLSILNRYYSELSCFTKHLRGATPERYLFSTYCSLAIVTSIRFGAAISLAALVSHLLDGLLIERNAIVYLLPLYGFYISIWTTSLWNRRNEVLNKLNGVLNQYWALLADCKSIVAHKLQSQLELFPATWDRYENVAYLKRVSEVYSSFEDEKTSGAIRNCLLDLASAVDHVKAYEQYEDFRYLIRTLDKSTGLISAENVRRATLFYVNQALFSDKRSFPYIVLFLSVIIVTTLTQPLVLQLVIFSVLLVIDYFCVQNLSKLNIGLFSISRNLAIKLHYQMKIKDLWH